jgi:hypothetical protein
LRSMVQGIGRPPIFGVAISERSQDQASLNKRHRA